MAGNFVRLLGATVAMAVLMPACYATDYNSVATNPSGVVITVVDRGPALVTARTFALPDTVVEIPVGSNTLDHVSDQQIVANVRAHMVALGWQDVGINPAATPDVILLIAAATRIETGVAYVDWFGAWGYLPYWGPSVDGGWIWGVPAGAVPYAFQAGTILISMLDRRSPNPTLRSIPLLWSAGIDGVVTTTANTTERALAGIDQAFVQSPYLIRVQ
jgi:Domain of unknown function (DUF4136)